MSETIAERLTGAIIDAFTTLAGARLHATLSANPEPDAAGREGWAARLGLTGTHTGSVTLWFDAALVDAVAVSAERAQEGAAPATTPRVRALVSELGAHLSSVPEFAGIDIDAHADPAPAPAPGGRTIRFRAADRSVGLAVVATELAPARSAPRRSDDARLEAVLDVELPLIVRFGRTVMPLSALAELGPGSVIDMARSPEEPVDLMVGERIIARGEVVIVSGNYGVRITELLGGRDAAPDLEARL